MSFLWVFFVRGGARPDLIVLLSMFWGFLFGAGFLHVPWIRVVCTVHVEVDRNSELIGNSESIGFYDGFSM